MALVINSNISALDSIDKARRNQNVLSTRFERISSGLRINSASDDAAGLAISNRMTAQSRGTQQAVRNANEYVSLFQTADGALGEISNSIQRIRELAVQSANFIYNDGDRESLDGEAQELVTNVDEIATYTNFNNIKLLDGNFLERLIQIGANEEAGETVSIRSAEKESLGSHTRFESIVGTTVADGHGLEEGQLVLNGIEIRRTLNSDDQVSVDVLDDGINVIFEPLDDDEGTRAASAIAKAAAINSHTEQTGVRAFVTATRTDHDFTRLNTQLYDNALGGTFGAFSSIQANTISSDEFIIINGEKLSDLVIQEFDADGTLKDSINALHEKTGVKAEVNARGELVLIAEDGRNINVQYRNQDGSANVDLEDDIGLSSGLDGFHVYGGGLIMVKENTAIRENDGTTFGDGINFEMGDERVHEALGGITEEVDDVGDSIFLSGDPYYFNNMSESHIGSLNLLTVENSRKAIITLDLALRDVVNQRSFLGAWQNRLDSTVANLSVQDENLQESRSQILDADIAQESAHLAQSQIIQNASTTVLAQVNQLPSQVLSLLQ
jgi:flagellin